MIRLCPQCRSDIHYTSERSFQKATQANAGCRSCCHKYLTDEQREKNKTPETISHRQLKSRYGVTLEDKQQMFNEQDGRCANRGCRRVFTSLSGAHLDHDHEMRMPRGLLCAQCNMALGLLQDSATIVAGLQNYLEERGIGALVAGHL